MPSFADRNNSVSDEIEEEDLDDEDYLNGLYGPDYYDIFDYEMPEQCDHGRDPHDICIDCCWDAHESDKVRLTDSAGFTYLVDPEVERQYQVYLRTGLYITDEDPWFEHDPRDYMYWMDDELDLCPHGNHPNGVCVSCDIEAHEGFLDTAESVLISDPFMKERAQHELTQKRNAARRDQTIRSHLRDKYNAHLAVIRETRYIRENALVLAKVPRLSVAHSQKETKKLADKPWSARFRNDPRNMRILRERYERA